MGSERALDKVNEKDSKKAMVKSGISSILIALLFALGVELPELVITEEVILQDDLTRQVGVMNDYEVYKEDLLAYWLVLNGKQPFISTDEGNQEFYWDEYN